MTLVEASVLGVVQGLTEFLPISSIAHLRVVPALFGWSDPGAAFSAVIQLGTLLAVLVYFASDLRDIMAARAKGNRQPTLRSGPSATASRSISGPTPPPWAVWM